MIPRPAPNPAPDGQPTVTGPGASGRARRANPIPQPGSSPAPGQADSAHDSFETNELAMACSHYEFGVIRSILPFRRGSRRSPKVVLETSRGRLLLKRRTLDALSVGQVTFSHAVIDRLTSRAVPVARLIRTRDGSGCVHLNGRLYEVFEFVQGARYDRSAAATAAAGGTLAAMHRALALATPPGRPRVGTYHKAEVVRTAFAELCDQPATAAVAARLSQRYAEAGSSVDAAGFDGWPTQIIHSDFHPGNLVFAPASGEEKNRVRAVLDFDACRHGPRSIDIANGAVQFAVTRVGQDPSGWPVELDVARLRAFLLRYDESPDGVLSRAELRALPWLMIEAMIAEAVIPVVTTGRFGPIDGRTFLEMVANKTEWIASNHEELASL